MKQFIYQSKLPHSQESVFSWHMKPGALERLTPPWEPVTIEQGIEGEMTEGCKVIIALKNGPITQRWHALHPKVEPHSLFVDVQESGPFASWTHQHMFIKEDKQAMLMKDHIEYQLPFSFVSNIVAGGYVENKLWSMFSYRHKTLRNDLDIIAEYNLAPKTILLSGASGLLGTALEGFLSCAGHNVRKLVRRPSERSNEFLWNPTKGEIDLKAFEGCDVVIHLSGESIAEGRWTKEKKKRIIDSRVVTTELLARSISALQQKPECFITASGIGIYGDRGEEELTEDSANGQGFLAEVARQWEAATQEAKDAGIRVAHMRLGAILTPKGGALSKMLLPFWLGLGGRLGDGKQYFSWIALDDVLYGIYHTIAQSDLSGPINFCAPHRLQNREFTKELGSVLYRPTLIPAPKFALKVALGEMAEELLFASTNAIPEKLEKSGFRFRYGQTTECLRHLLGRSLS